jgi:hypothetical protein
MIVGNQDEREAFGMADSGGRWEPAVRCDGGRAALESGLPGDFRGAAIVTATVAALREG